MLAHIAIPLMEIRMPTKKEIWPNIEKPGHEQLVLQFFFFQLSSGNATADTRRGTTAKLEFSILMIFIFGKVSQYSHKYHSRDHFALIFPRSGFPPDAAVAAIS